MTMSSAVAAPEGKRFIDIYPHLFTDEERETVSALVKCAADDAAERAEQLKQLKRIEAMIDSGRWD